MSRSSPPPPRRVASAALVLLLACPVAAAPVDAAVEPVPTTPPARELVIPLGATHGSLRVAVPAGWTAAVEQPEDRLPPTLTFTPLDPKARGEVLLTPLWSPDGSLNVAAPETLRSLIGRAAMATPAAEPVRPQPLASGPGFWFDATDSRAAAGPDAYSHVTVVVAACGDLALSGTALADEAGSRAREALLGLVAAAEHRTSEATLLTTELRAPAGSWAVSLAVPAELTMAAPNASPDGGSVRLQAGTAKSRVQVTAYIEPNPDGRSAAAHRDQIATEADALPPEATQLGIRVADKKTWDEGDRALVAYSVVAAGGREVIQRSQSVILALDGAWVDVHASVAGFQPEDQALLDAIAASVRVVR